MQAACRVKSLRIIMLYSDVEYSARFSKGFFDVK